MNFQLIEACNLLQIDPNSSDLIEVAKKSFRKLAKTLHPDKVGNDSKAEQFTKIKEAYEFIKNFNPIQTQPIHFDLGSYFTPNTGFNVTVDQNVSVTHNVDEHGNVSVVINL